MNIDGTVCLLQTGIMAGPVVEISVLRTIQHEQCVCTAEGLVANSVPTLLRSGSE